MLRFKSRDGKIVMTENTQTGEITTFEESLKPLETEVEPETEKPEEEVVVDGDNEEA